MLIDSAEYPIRVYTRLEITYRKLIIATHFPFSLLEVCHASILKLHNNAVFYLYNYFLLYCVVHNFFQFFLHKRISDRIERGFFHFEK